MTPTEEFVRLPVDEGVALYGKYRPAATAAAPLVVLVHGFTSHMDEALHYNAARRLSAEDFSVLRFNLYGLEPDTRRLTECTATQHGRDLEAVLRQVRTADRPTYVIGHSLGGLTALLATEPVDGIVLWDSTHTDALAFLEDLEYVDSLRLYRVKQRVDHLVNPAMVEQLHGLDSDDLVRRVRTPMLVVGCDDDGRPELAGRYAQNAGGPAELVIVPDSDHSFTRGETQAQLYDVTVEWLRAQRRRAE